MNIKEIKKVEDDLIHYELIDDGGSNIMLLPILLSIGTVFEHEYGKYKVSKIIENVVLCDRIRK
jgi:hypothetical protein